MEYKKYNFKSFNLYTIKTTKFKNCHLEIVFRSPLTKEKIIPRKFLMELMSFSTLNYPSQKDLNIHLEELYNTTFYSFLSRVGGTLLTNFCFDFLSPEYCEKEYLENVLNLAKEIIFNPHISKDTFNEENFKIVKNNILNAQQEALDNKKNYAFRKLFQFMDKDSYLSYDMLGTKEEIENITNKKVFQEYRKMFEEDYCDIYVIGNLDMKYIVKFWEENFPCRIIKNYSLTLFSDGKTRKRTLIKKETAPLAQAHLIVGCNIIVPSSENDTLAYVYNYILGGGTIDNKLGNLLRQDNTLCYTTNSLYQKYDNVIIVYAGIDSQNYNKALTLIKKALKEMTNKVTEQELENAKKGLITALTMIEDSPSSLINNYLFQNIANLESVDKRIEKIKKLTTADIMKFAKKVKINTIYMLSGVK